MWNNSFIIILLTVLCISCKEKKEVASEKVHHAKCQNEFTLRFSLPEDCRHYVTPAIPGNLKEIMFGNNDSVKKGQIIAYLVSSEYLDIQERYLTVRYELEYLKEDFKRQGELTVENVTSIKKLQKAQTEYNTKDAICLSLEKKLKLAGFNPERIYKKGPEKYAYLLAPVTGKIQYHSLSTGMYLDNKTPNIYIQTKDSLIAEIFLEQNQRADIRSGTVFEILNEEDVICTATANGKLFMKSDGEWMCKAILSERPASLYNGLFLKARLKK